MSLLYPDRRFAVAPGRRDQLEFEQLPDRFQRLLDQAFAGVIPAERDLWSPLVDIEEEDDAYVIEADLPGVKKDDVKIEFAGNELTISGEIKEHERKGVLRRKVRHTGEFLYRVVLPDQVESEKIEASLNDGVLALRVPKAQKAERRKIEIKAA